MSKVCQEWFPETDGFYMEGYLAEQIEIAVKNITKDWDFTIVITGGGEVRVGKSLLAMQIMVYWNYMMWKIHKIKVPFSLEENVVFKWDKLIEQGNALGQKSKYCALCYDEAGETMEGVKAQSKELKAVRDYLRECGQYNFLNVLVLPEFFDLPKGVAVTRSIFLIDVYYRANDRGIFERGYFKFYSRKNKKLLYLNGKKDYNYNAQPFNFCGRFTNFYPIDEQKYRAMKIEALKQREQAKAENLRGIPSRDALFFYLRRYLRVSYGDLSLLLKKLLGIEILPKTIETAVAHFITNHPKEISSADSYLETIDTIRNTKKDS